MGLFATKKANVDLELRLTALSTAVHELKTAHKHLELEWEELYDKVRHQMARMSRRAKVDLKENGEALPEDEPVDDGLSSDPISEAIHKRRNRGFIQR